MSLLLTISIGNTFVWTAALGAQLQSVLHALYLILALIIAWCVNVIEDNFIFEMRWHCGKRTGKKTRREKSTGQSSVVKFNLCNGSHSCVNCRQTILCVSAESAVAKIDSILSGTIQSINQTACKCVCALVCVWYALCVTDWHCFMSNNRICSVEINWTTMLTTVSKFVLFRVFRQLIYLCEHFVSK